MKKMIVVLIALLVLPSITLAAKGGNKPPDVDYEALIAEGDAALQSQIDSLQSLVSEIYTSNRFGNILVYDANDQFLGILLSADPEDKSGVIHYVAEIFIPTLNIATVISEYLTPAGTGNIITDNIHFGDSNCLGDLAYIERIGISRPDMLYRAGTRYFIASAPVIPYAEAEPTSSRLDVLGDCTNNSGYTNAHYSRAKEVLEADIPFSLPIALPLRYEF